MSDPLRRWRRLVPMFALILAATAGRAACAGSIGLSLHESGFTSPADASGNFAYVTDSATYNPATLKTTVDFLIHAAFPSAPHGESIDSFGFNSTNTALASIAFTVYA